MSPAAFVQAHAAHADWRVALAQCQTQVQTQIAARAAEQAESAPFTLGWCYLSDYYAPAAERYCESDEKNHGASLPYRRGHKWNKTTYPPRRARVRKRRRPRAAVDKSAA